MLVFKYNGIKCLKALSSTSEKVLGALLSTSNEVLDPSMYVTVAVVVPLIGMGL